jgi:NADPH:quinone reductase-like Zn-dependent oxidoreductase
MKAWRLAAYNTDPGAAIDSMTLETNIKVPSEIGPDQVLVRVKYASINPIDWKLFTGTMQ